MKLRCWRCSKMVEVGKYKGNKDDITVCNKCSKEYSEEIREQKEAKIKEAEK